MPERQQPLERSDFSRFVAMTTRLQDNDIYGHMNNVRYNEYFDTAVNQTLIEAGVLDMHNSPVIGLVAASHATYFKPIAFPDKITVGVRVARLGRSSVDYEFALFREDDATAVAQGGYTHVYVNRQTSRPVDLPANLRAALEPLHRATAQAPGGNADSSRLRARRRLP